MGQGVSQEEMDAVGYRVLGVEPKSPASTAGLVSFFDFVIAANGQPLKVHDNTFVTMIEQSEDKPLPLTIYNIKSETTRDVVITPKRNWGGKGSLGVTIRFDSFWRAEESLVRVLEVVPDSPADMAGLQAEDDYLLGTAEKVFKDTETLYEEVQKKLDDTIEIFVYNTKTDEVRVEVVMPTFDWGDGQGCLGLSVGHGYLHRLPARCKQSAGSSVAKPNVFPAQEATASSPATDTAAAADEAAAPAVAPAPADVATPAETPPAPPAPAAAGAAPAETPPVEAPSVDVNLSS